ncbi:P-loop containing nucleoside triphosphate hydrolase [Abortiporus biennis]
MSPTLHYCHHWLARGVIMQPFFSFLNSSFSLAIITFHSEAKTKTFEDIGLKPSIANAVLEAFPDITHPTEAQSSFIPAILNKKDVLLKDKTGSGKTFGVILALLCKARQNASARDQRRGFKPNITSILITPHRDLAYQCEHWVKEIFDRIAQPEEDISSAVQVIVRNTSTPLKSQVEKLNSTPPHLVIGTPQALLEVYKEDPEALQLNKLSAVVVDEVDYLIETSPKPGRGFEHAKLKYDRKLKKHPSPTRQLLNAIYHRSNKLSGINEQAQVGIRRPQLILSSATLRAQFRRSLMVENDWLTQSEGMLVKVTGSETLEGSQDNITHCAIVVSEDGSMKNVPWAEEASVDAIPAAEEDATQETDSKASSQVEESSATDSVDLTPDIEEIMEGAEDYSGIPSPFNPVALEAVAATFAVDVPLVALLVLPASAPVRRAVYDLRHLGVNAVGLDVAKENAGGAYMMRKDGKFDETNPTLLVSTLVSTRGMDLPQLSHVFVLGPPEDRSADTYLHIAGRVGRFGRGGKVVSILEEKREVRLANGKDGFKDEPLWMKRIYDRVGVKVKKVEHFE